MADCTKPDAFVIFPAAKNQDASHKLTNRKNMRSKTQTRGLLVLHPAQKEPRHEPGFDYLTNVVYQLVTAYASPSD